MKVSEIEAVGRTKIFTGEMRVYKDMSELNEYIKEVDVYTAEQMQEYAEVKRDYILIIDGGIGTKLHATDRFTGTEAVDVYGDKYKVVNHVKNGKMWVLDNEEDTKND